MLWLLLFLGCLVGSDVVEEKQEWDGFLGGAAGLTSDADLPVSWSPDENRRWSFEIPGYGQSSPVAWEGRLVVTSTEGPEKDQYHVLCLDATGKELWRQTIDNSAPVKNSVYVSRAAPTPVVDAQGIVAFFESGDVVAYDWEGQQRWKIDLNQKFAALKAEFGLAASPCQDDQHVFVLLEQEGPSCLLALSKKTGEVVWKTDRESRSSWASPAILDVSGSPQIVISSKGSVDGYDPKTGQRLWQYQEIDGNTGPTPVDLGEGRFLTGASGGRGEPSPLAKRSNGLMQVVKEGDQFSLKPLWVAEAASVSWASPVAFEGYAYWVNRVGVVFCYDMNDGELVYQERLADSCWATPFAAGDYLYFPGKSGTVSVIKKGPVFEVVAKNETWKPEEIQPPKLPEETDETRARSAANFNAPVLYGYVVIGDSVVFRVGNRLFCVGKE